MIPNSRGRLNSRNSQGLRGISAKLRVAWLCSSHDRHRERMRSDPEPRTIPGLLRRSAPRNDGRSDERAFDYRLIRAAPRELRAAFTVRTGDNHNVAIGVAEPNLPVLGRGVDVRFFNDLRPQPASALDSQIEIVELEPQHDAMSGRRRVGVDEIGMVFRVPGVELKKQPTRAPDPIVYVAVRVMGKCVCSEQFGNHRLLARTLRTAMSG